MKGLCTAIPEQLLVVIILPVSRAHTRVKAAWGLQRPGPELGKSAFSE